MATRVPRTNRRRKAWKCREICPLSHQRRSASGGRRSITLVVVRPDRPADADAQGANLRPQAAAGDAQDAGRLDLVAARVLEDAGEQLPLDQGEALGVQVLRPGGDALLDEAVQL